MCTRSRRIHRTQIKGHEGARVLREEAQSPVGPQTVLRLATHPGVWDTRSARMAYASWRRTSRRWWRTSCTVWTATHCSDRSNSFG